MVKFKLIESNSNSREIITAITSFLFITIPNELIENIELKVLTKVEKFEIIGFVEPIGTRTQNFWIKSPILYQLSYTPNKTWYHRAKRTKNAIIKANKAMASVSAKPKIAILNNSSFKDGFLEMLKINEPKTLPIPIPAPANPIVDKPAPIHLKPNKSVMYKE